MNISALFLIVFSIRCTAQQSAGGTTSSTQIQFNAPTDKGDDGIGNYGDLIYRYRQPGDRKLMDDIVIVADVERIDKIVRWKTRAFGKTITTVRAFNLGRQRAVTQKIDVGGDWIEVTALVPANKDPRLLVEVYGIDRYAIV